MNKSQINNYKKKHLSYIEHFFNSSAHDLLLKQLIKRIKFCINKKSNIYIFGNGGSGLNAMHMANDLMLVFKSLNYKANVESLNSNPGIITCFANDFNYQNVFLEQLKIKVKKNDLVIMISGSGNSKNIVESIKYLNKEKIYNFSIIGFNGGKLKNFAENFIHFDIEDMQIFEDLTSIFNHLVVKYFLYKL